MQLVLLLAVPCLAHAQQRRSVNGWVEVWKGDRLAGVEVRATNVADDLTSQAGEFAIPLPAELKPGSPIHVEVTGEGESWVVVGPWDGWAYVPHLGDSLRVFVLAKGDKRFVSDTEIVRRIVEAATSRLDAGHGVGAQPQVVLADLSIRLGHELEELKSGIAEWGEGAKDPYLRGLFDLYSGRYEEAGTLIRESLSASEADLVEKNLALASAEYAQGHYQAAESALLKARPLCPENPLILNALGVVLLAEARHADAESLFRSALAIRQAALGDKHPDVAASLNNLAELLRAQGRYTDAEPFNRRALEIYEAALGSEHPHVAGSMYSVAELLRAQGKYAEAERLSRGALAIWETALGSWHPNVATALNSLASVLHEQGKYEVAELLYRRSLDIYETTLGPQHPHVAIALNNLGEQARAQGRYAEAEQLYRRALEIYDAVESPEQLWVAACLANLAKVLSAQGRITEAEPLHRRALEIREAVLGPDHPDVGVSLNDLGLLLGAQGEYAEAERLFRRALDNYETGLGPEHLNVAATLNNLPTSSVCRGNMRRRRCSADGPWR